MITKDSIEFLQKNCENNSKEWFHAHKDEYTKLILHPLTDIVMSLGVDMEIIDNMIVTIPKTSQTISRIYRDTRFSKDKALYRDNMWISFSRNKRLFPNYPEFYFGFSPDEFYYGMGYYCADRKTMDCMRNLIISNDSHFKKAFAEYESQDIFEISDNLYKRSKFPDQPENIKLWLDQKSICFNHDSNDFELLFSDRLSETLAEDLKKLKLTYEFLIFCENTKNDKFSETSFNFLQ